MARLARRIASLSLSFFLSASDRHLASYSSPSLPSKPSRANLGATGLLVGRGPSTPNNKKLLNKQKPITNEMSR